MSRPRPAADRRRPRGRSPARSPRRARSRASRRCGRRAAGPAIAAAARPTAERDGVLTVTCEAAVWAQELELMGCELIERLNAALGGEPFASCAAGPVDASR